MARTALQKIYADFRQGFVTVANPLAFPEGSLKDIVNFDIQDNGTLRLRPGLRQDTDTVVDTGLSLAAVNDLALSVHVWDNVNNNGDERIAVIQVGTWLFFYPMTDNGIDLDNPELLTGGVLGDALNINLGSVGSKISISATSGSGWLFVTHPNKRPTVIKKTPEGIESDFIDLRVRDLSLWEGKDLPNGDTADQVTGLLRKGTLYPQHEYNLVNSGWPSGSNTWTSDGTFTNGEVTRRDAVTYTFDKLGFYPNVGTPFAAGRSGGGDLFIKQQAYSPWQIETDYFGNGVPPLGHNIVFAEVWSRVGLGVTRLADGDPSTIYTKEYRWESYPTSVEFYADRVWYAGAKGYLESSPSDSSYEKEDGMDVSNTIYFSQQILNNLEKVSKCYQENDPTAEDINQLLATDGGTISVRGAGTIFDIKTFGTSLVVFASEGIWTISGIDANSFKADSFSVNKISNIGPSSKGTISATNNNIYYIANDAIYVLTGDQVTGLPTPQDLTSGKIKDFYNDIPYRNKERAKAFFDASNRNLYVFYSDIEVPEQDISNLAYNKCLIFNQDLGAFYKYDIALSKHFIVDGLFYNKDQTVTLTDAVVSGADIVVSDGDPVVLEESYSTASLNNVQLLTIVDGTTNAEFTFSSFTDLQDRTDWGADYTGYVEFGFDSAGDIMRDSKKAPIIVSHMERTEDGFEEDIDGNLILTNGSSCLLSYGWDWATSYKNPMQIYRFNRNYVPAGTEDPFNYGVDVITTRNRIRGKGHSLGIRLDSEAGKDCRILGLGIMYTAAQRV